MSMLSEQVKELRKLANSKEFEMHEPVTYGFYRKIKSKLFKAADTIEALSAKLAAGNMENCGGWQPISEYTREKYDWVLVKYFDGEEECIPQVAELRSDGKWHVSADFDGDYAIPSWFDVRYFFDMQQLDRS